MHTLVAGGAGYIGSHMVKQLLQAGHHVVTYDDLSSGHRDAVLGGELVDGNIRDTERLARTLREYEIDAVLHFAARIEVGESVRRPDLYYQTNVGGSRSLLDAMRAAGVGQLVFSSTAAVYGEPEDVPIPEDHPKRPGNPYGASKWMVERMLADEAAAFGLRSVALRYFNAAGADPEGELGERHDPETHLIPLVCQAAAGRRPAITVFGRDYPTPDGTCLRDYIHVHDLCSAHLTALEYLAAGGTTSAFNLGYGVGTSVQEIIDQVERVSGIRVPVEEGPRRAGDPARLVADASRAREVLGWRPAYDDLERIVADAWRWERAHFGGGVHVAPATGAGMAHAAT
jgi:UDP-glucose 4-epimerase